MTLNDALLAHDTALRRGGAAGVISLAQVEAAIGRPYTGYYRSITSKCAALTQSICRNHGFTDGNKRTCLLLVSVLLDRSGYSLQPRPNEAIDDALEHLAVSTADGTLTFDDIHRWFVERIKRRQQRRRGPT